MSTDKRLHLLGCQADELFRLACRVVDSYLLAAQAGHRSECNRLARLHRHYHDEHNAVHLQFTRLRQSQIP